MNTFLKCLGAVALLGSHLASAASPQAPARDLQSLQTIGNAYAKTAGRTLSSVTAADAGSLSQDPPAWEKRLSEAMTVGYAPAGTTRFEPRAYDQIRTILHVEMGRHRTVDQLVKDIVSGGGRVDEVTWTFGTAKPVKSYAVFDAQGDFIFDTLLVLPVLTVPFEEGQP